PPLLLRAMPDDRSRHLGLRRLQGRRLDDARRQRASRRSEKTQAPQLTRDAPPRIHPTSVVGPNVELAAGVEIGPLCLLDGKIRIGARTRLIGHVTILGITELGADNVLHPGAVIGDEPQDLTYTGVARSVKIGDRNIFREYSTVHRGCEHGEVTIMGDDVAHDGDLAMLASAMNGGVFAKDVAVADFHRSRDSRVGQVLRLVADHRARMQHVVGAELGDAENRYVTDEASA